MLTMNPSKLQKKHQEKTRSRNQAGKAFERDMVSLIGSANHYDYLAGHYTLGLLMALHHRVTIEPTFIDWRLINARITDKFGADALEALKTYAKTRLVYYKLTSDPGHVEAAVGSVLRKFAKRETEKV